MKMAHCLSAWYTTDFIDTRPSNKNSREHLAIRLRQSCAPNMCRSCFQKYGGHFVACSFDMVASYSSSLRWRLVFLLVQELSAIAIARLLKVGLTFVKKIRKNTEILPRLITQPGREKQDKWTVGEKRIA